MTVPATTHPEALRVVQLVTTLARGGAQATVIASSDPTRPGLGAAFRLGRGHGQVRVEVPIEVPIEMEVWAGPDDTGEGSWRDDPALAPVTVITVPDLVRSLDPIRDLRALVWLIRRLRAVRPDVLHTHSSKAGVLGRLAARLAGVPCVHTVHGWGPVHAARGPLRSVVVALERAMAHLCVAVVVVGRADLAFGLDHRIGRPDRYRLIRSGIDLPESGCSGPGTRSIGDEVRRELDLGTRFVVGMVGRLARQKDQATLIEAFDRADLVDATLVLVGDGPLRSELEDLARARPHCDIRFVGARPDGARMVAGFDVAVNASRWEGLPRVVVEAAAAGVPVVATDVGSTAELIESGRSGWLVRPRDIDELARALAEVATDRAEARARAAEARRRVEEFSVQRMIEDLVALWSGAAERSVVVPSSGSARST